MRVRRKGKGALAHRNQRTWLLFCRFHSTVIRSFIPTFNKGKTGFLLVIKESKKREQQGWQAEETDAILIPCICLFYLR